MKYKQFLNEAIPSKALSHKSCFAQLFYSLKHIKSSSLIKTRLGLISHTNSRRLSYHAALLISSLFLLSQPVFADSDDFSWYTWLNTQVGQHPDIIAEQESMNAQMSLAKALGNPLYNPEIETELEREGNQSNYLLGINQTLDWWGKKDIRQQQADIVRAIAQAQFNYARQKKASEIVQALVEWNATKKKSRITLEQEVQLDSLLSQLKNRQQAGDLGQADAELAFLGLAQKLGEAAVAQAQFKAADAQLHQLISDWRPQAAQIPDSLWASAELNTAIEVDLLPEVFSAIQEWKVQQQLAELAQLEKKADPTVGVNIGKTGSDKIIGVKFSVPLNVRNNFNAEAEAAYQQALSAEASYQAKKRNKTYTLKASKEILQEYRIRLKRWNQLMRGRGDRIEALLQAQWQSGDLSTPEYLLALQQRAEGLIAGIELQANYRTAYVEWLLQSNQIQLDN